MQIQCTNCRQPYPLQGVPHRCPNCGGIFDYAGAFKYDTSSLEPELPGIWRYRHTFGFPAGLEPLSLGEGDTPLIWARVFGRQVAFKCEFLNPSGSFKDRGSATLAAFVRSRGVTVALEDSSGNAGASFAAYAARAGLQARIFVPESTSGPKRAQIEITAADLATIPGPRSNAAEAVLRVLSEPDNAAAYASHAYQPFNLPGYATLAYELVAQLGCAPGSVLLPVGQGGLLLGASRGFQALKDAGIIVLLPQLVGVQARACAPLWALSTYGPSGLAWVAEAPTLAEGIRVRLPVRGDAVLQAVTTSNGGFLAVDEEEILPGRVALAKLGMFIEPTSAVVWGALAQVIHRLPEPVVVVLTGSGFKYMGSG
jgi:threonine synthase